jgi:hypothetical protein
MGFQLWNTASLCNTNIGLSGDVLKRYTEHCFMTKMM